MSLTNLKIILSCGWTGIQQSISFPDWWGSVLFLIQAPIACWSLIAENRGVVNCGFSSISFKYICILNLNLFPTSHRWAPEGSLSSRFGSQWMKPCLSLNVWMGCAFCCIVLFNKVSLQLELLLFLPTANYNRSAPSLQCSSPSTSSIFFSVFFWNKCKKKKSCCNTKWIYMFI